MAGKGRGEPGGLCLLGVIPGQRGGPQGRLFVPREGWSGWVLDPQGSLFLLSSPLLPSSADGGIQGEHKREEREQQAPNSLYVQQRASLCPQTPSP